uniref:Uncharacterized protein n=1 Tax=Cucumis melo TaxID=3656 RepID=A0A9I9DDS4_CUCME
MVQLFKLTSTLKQPWSISFQVLQESIIELGLIPNEIRIKENSTLDVEVGILDLLILSKPFDRLSFGPRPIGFGPFLDPSSFTRLLLF